MTVAHRDPDVGGHRLDHPPYPGFLELVRQLVEMGNALEDHFFLGPVDLLQGDRLGAVAALAPLEAGAVGECVDQPGLTLGQGPHLIERLRGEGLAGLLRVLQQQRPDLIGVEVTEA